MILDLNAAWLQDDRQEGLMAKITSLWAASGALYEVLAVQDAEQLALCVAQLVGRYLKGVVDAASAEHGGDEAALTR